VAFQLAEMRMVRWMCVIMLHNRIPSKGLRERLGLDDIISVPQYDVNSPFVRHGGLRLLLSTIEVILHAPGHSRAHCCLLQTRHTGSLSPSPSAPHLRQLCLHPKHSVFYRLDALPATQPTASKHCLFLQ